MKFDFEIMFDVKFLEVASLSSRVSQYVTRDIQNGFNNFLKNHYSIVDFESKGNRLHIPFSSRSFAIIMSLAFVSSAVLSSTDGVSHNQESAIDSKEVQDVRSRQAGGQQPLFQQLQANKDKDEEERAEFQRNIMRGTMTLDDEDCAHLDAIQKQKVEQLQHIRQSMDDEIALFRAAKADRSESQLVLDDEDDAAERSTPIIKIKKLQPPKPLVPMIIINKKRQYRQPEQLYDISSKKPKTIIKETFVHSKNADNTNKLAIPENYDNIAHDNSSGLSLLSGYGSSSDSG